jgi:hypothetical protein
MREQIAIQRPRRSYNNLLLAHVQQAYGIQVKPPGIRGNVQEFTIAALRQLVQ